MADINPNDSATLTDDLEIDSYDDVVNLFGTDEAAAMLADVVGNRFNRQEILKAIRNGWDIHLDYWPEYGGVRLCRAHLRRTARGHLACVGRWPHRPGQDQDAQGADRRRPVACRHLRAHGQVQRRAR